MNASSYVYKYKIHSCLEYIDVYDDHRYTYLHTFAYMLTRMLC